MKHINILHTLLLISGLGLGTSSCNDFLDKLPDNRTELDTEQKITKLLISAYPEVTANELFELSVTTPTTMDLNTPIISWPKKIATTGKIPRKNIRTLLTIYGKDTTKLLPLQTWY